MSNALGTINPVERDRRAWRTRGRAGAGRRRRRRRRAHAGRRAGARLRLLRLATGHKLYGPTGIGVLYGASALLEAMPPFLGGGDMIRSVTFEKSTWNALPLQVRGRHAEHRGRDRPRRGDRLHLVGSASTRSAATSATCSTTPPRRSPSDPGVRMIGTAPHKASILSFVMDGVHPHDIGTIVDREGVAIRTGHHCAQPVMERFGVPATARASLAMYNTREESTRWPRALRKVARCSADVGPERPLPGGDPRPQQAAEELPRARGASHHAEGYNPLCGDADAHGPGRRRNDQGRGVPGLRLRDLEGVGVADDRRGEGQDASPKRGRCSSASTGWSRRRRISPSKTWASSRCSPACASSRCA